MSATTKAATRRRRRLQPPSYLECVQAAAQGHVLVAEARSARCYYCNGLGHHILVCLRLEADKKAYLKHLKQLSTRSALAEGHDFGALEDGEGAGAGSTHAESPPQSVEQGDSTDAGVDTSEVLFAQDKAPGHRKCHCGQRIATFGCPGEPRQAARWCSTCPTRPAGVVAVASRQCKCEKKACPNFGLPGSKKAIWCSKCPGKPMHAVDVAASGCECKSSKYPSFAMPGGTRKDAKWCILCPSKPPDAVNTLSVHCPCGKSATFAFPGGYRKWCGECRPAGAVNVVSKKCECGKRIPSFGLPVEDALGVLRIPLRWCNACPGLPTGSVTRRTFHKEKRKREAVDGNAT